MDVRAQAASVLSRLLHQRGSLATLLPSAADKVAPQDRALLQELCYGVCRWYPRLDLIIQQLLQKPLRAKDLDIQALLAIGLYQLGYLRTPDHAAVNTAVEAANALKKSWATKLINGVLRRFLRERDALEKSLQGNAVYQSAHPPWLLAQIARAWPAKADAIFTANNQTPPFTLRVNRQKISRDDYQQLLQQQGINCTNTPFSADGLTLSTPVGVETLPGFDQGFASVQDEAPQLCAGLLRCQDGHRVLDACSAPGGKTAHLLEINPNLHLVALDIAETRAQRTRNTLRRLGLNAEVKVGDAGQPTSWWQGNHFDRILLDAPCSASGIIRRQPDIKILRHAESLTKLVNNQWRILNAVWPLLARGGELLYATCSIIPSENTQLIERFVREQTDARYQPIAVNWGIDVDYGQQLLPLTNGHDGFFYARLVKD